MKCTVAIRWGILAVLVVAGPPHSPRPPFSHEGRRGGCGAGVPACLSSAPAFFPVEEGDGSGRDACATVPSPRGRGDFRARFREAWSRSVAFAQPIKLVEAAPDSADAPLEVAAPEDGAPLSVLLDWALAHSPALAVQRAKLGEARMNALAAGRLPNPEVTGGGKKVGGEHSGPVFEIGQELPVNRALGLQRRAAFLARDSVSRTLEREIQIVLTEVQRAYVDVLAASEELKTAGKALRISKGSFDILSSRKGSGLISPLPYNLAAADFANARRAERLAETELGLARAKLAQIVGIPEAGLPHVAGNLRAPFLSVEVDPARFDRPDEAAARLRTQSARTAAEAADRARIPNPIVGYEREESGNETENSFKIGLEIPILNNGVPTVRLRQAETQTAQAELDAVLSRIEAERSQARSRLESRREAARIHEEEIQPAVDESLKSADAVLRGGLNVEILLQTQQRLLDMEREYVDTLRELRHAELDYLLALGTPSGR